MSQGSQVLPTTGTVSGLALAQAVNAALASLASQTSGATDPSTLAGGVQPFSFWADTSVTPNMLRQRNAANTAWNVFGDMTQAGLGLATIIALQQGLYTSVVAGGTSDALTGSFSPAITSTTMASGVVEVTIRAAFANATTTPTFTPNSGVITAQNIVKGNGLALATGDIAGAGHWITLQWDATLTKWVLLNPATGISGFPTGTVIESAAPAPPPGYLACPIAQTNLSRSTYANLYNALTIQTTATWTNGASSIAVANAALMAIGYPMSGTGIAAGTTISSISGTTVGLSLATTAAGTGAAIVVAPWGVGDGSTTFGMPWFPADYATVQANGNLGTQTVGAVISHAHSTNAGVTNSGGGTLAGGSSLGLATPTINATGGAANLAAGVRMNRFVKY